MPVVLKIPGYVDSPQARIFEVSNCTHFRLVAAAARRPNTRHARAESPAWSAGEYPHPTKNSRSRLRRAAALPGGDRRPHGQRWLRASAPGAGPGLSYRVGLHRGESDRIEISSLRGILGFSGFRGRSSRVQRVQRVQEFKDKAYNR